MTSSILTFGYGTPASAKTLSAPANAINLLAELIKRVGEPGRKLHTGRSRNDQVALGFEMWIFRTSWDVAVQLRTLQKAFVRLADQSRGSEPLALPVHPWSKHYGHRRCHLGGAQIFGGRLASPAVCNDVEGDLLPLVYPVSCSHRP